MFIYPLPLEPACHPHPHPPQVVRERRAELPVLYSRFPLAIYVFLRSTLATVEIKVAGERMRSDPGRACLVGNEGECEFLFSTIGPGG